MSAKKRKRPRRSQKNNKMQRSAVSKAKAEKNDHKTRQQHYSQMRQELLAEIQPLLRDAKDATSFSDPALNEMVEAVIYSELMADEPELEAIFFEPLDCEEAFYKVGQKMGIDPDRIAELDHQEAFEIHLDISQKCIQQLLTDNMRYEILEGVNSLRMRLKDQGKHEKAMQAAAVQLFLTSKRDRESWPMMGVVQAIFQRSLDVGFYLIGSMVEAIEISEERGGKIPLREKLKRSLKSKKVDIPLKRYPGLEKFLEKQTDQIWDEGIEAIYQGQLYLDLFTEEELAGIFKVAAQVYCHDGMKDLSTLDPASFQLPDDFNEKFFNELEKYMSELLTPKRLDDIKAHIDMILESDQNGGEWFLFLSLLESLLQEKHAKENLMSFFMSAILGELRIAYEDIQKSKG